MSAESGKSGKSGKSQGKIFFEKKSGKYQGILRQNQGTSEILQGNFFFSPGQKKRKTFLHSNKFFLPLLFHLSEKLIS